MKHRRAIKRRAVVRDRRQEAGAEAEIFDAAAQFGGGGFRVLRGEQGDAFEARALAHETIIEPVVVALRDRRRPGRELNHANRQRGGRIEHRAIDAVFILKTYPGFGVGVFAFAFAREAALPTVGIEHRPGRVPVHLAEIAFDVSENILVVFHDVAVGVDNEFCHCLVLLEFRLGCHLRPFVMLRASSAKNLRPRSFTSFRMTDKKFQFSELL